MTVIRYSSVDQDIDTIDSSLSQTLQQITQSVAALMVAMFTIV